MRVVAHRRSGWSEIRSHFTQPLGCSAFSASLRLIRVEHGLPNYQESIRDADKNDEDQLLSLILCNNNSEHRIMETFIARQPIFDRNTSVHGYELLYRPSAENSFAGSNLDEASVQTIVDSHIFAGSGNILEGKIGYINFTRSTLLRNCAFLLPRESTVIEILESVPPDREVIEACRKAKASGYRIALDDYVYDDARAALTDLADLIKVDFLATSPEEQQQLAQRFKPRGISLCAEKVESWDVAKRAAEMGYTLFQGYFFGKPVILTGQDIPASKLHYLKVIRELHQPEIQFRNLEALISEDLSLTYKLLRYLNSAAFCFRREIGSVRQAIVQLGEQGIRKWITLIALVQISNGCVTELVNRALMRASMCESIATSLGLRRSAEDLYLMGLFSCLDAVLGRELSEVLDELSITREIRNGLLGEEGMFGDIFKCTLAYENGSWKEVGERAAKLQMKEAQLPEMYWSAVNHASEVSSAVA
jgi:c-di-GMP-related signal transduction protein